MDIIPRRQIQHQTIDNLISAGIIEPNESDICYDGLSAMSMEELLIVMVESHQLREEFGNSPHLCVSLVVEGVICPN